MTLRRASRALCKAVDALSFSAPVAYTLNPLQYARTVHEAYLERYGAAPKQTVLLGMNPGPYGMAQTGVPFGEIAAVRDHLGLEGVITSPKSAPEARPILGFACPRSEVSGQRLWGAIRARHPDPQTFFAHAFVVNYCPLLFLDAKLANLVPERLRRDERRALEAVCDQHLQEVAALLTPTRWIAVGKYAALCIQRALDCAPLILPHPSPASPLANRGWAEAARACLHDHGVDDIL